jgi:hypothetical protein
MNEFLLDHGFDDLARQVERGLVPTGREAAVIVTGPRAGGRDKADTRKDLGAGAVVAGEIAAIG